MDKYIIDNEIVFSPQEKQLLSLKNSSTFTMHSASSSCLTLLLEKHGEVVTQPELMVAGWGTNAMRTLSNAAYYQCFVNLRKVFRELGYQKEILTTVRGKGIRVNKYVRIKKVVEDGATISPLRQQDISKPEQPVKHNLRRAELSPAFLTSEAAFLPAREAQPETASEPVVVKKIFSQRIVYLLLLLGGLLSIAFFIWTIINKENEFTIDGYRNFAKEPSCVYFNDRNDNNDFVVGFLQRHGYNCSAGKKYFVSYFSTSPRLTIFICGPQATLKCDSVTYIVDKND